MADIFDRDGDGYINYQEFVAALRPDRDQGKPVSDAKRIQDEVKRQASKCTCTKQFRIHKIGEGKYRVSKTDAMLVIKIFNSVQPFVFSKNISQSNDMVNIVFIA